MIERSSPVAKALYKVFLQRDESQRPLLLAGLPHTLISLIDGHNKRSLRRNAMAELRRCINSHYTFDIITGTTFTTTKEA